MGDGSFAAGCSAERLIAVGGNYAFFKRFERPPARLPRNVPEKPKGFPLGIPPDHHELPPFVARHHGFSRSTRKALAFFRPITRRIQLVGASSITIK
jgi:hypothetical protein